MYRCIGVSGCRRKGSVPVESLKTILDRIYRIDRIVKTVIRKIARALRGPLLFQEPGREPEEEKRGTGEKERRNVDQHHRHSGPTNNLIPYSSSPLRGED